MALVSSTMCRAVLWVRAVFSVAKPKAPPTLRARLTSPEAFLTMCGGRVAIVTCCEAIMAIMTPQPRMAWTPANSQNPHSSVTRRASHMPQAARMKPTNIRMRASTSRTSRPAKGAVANMARPDTIMVVPTSAAE
ncbi:hypothetical protein D3C73_1295270 [compost metagenome]